MAQGKRGRVPSLIYLKGVPDHADTVAKEGSLVAVIDTWISVAVDTHTR